MNTCLLNKRKERNNIKDDKKGIFIKGDQFYFLIIENITGFEGD